MSGAEISIESQRAGAALRVTAHGENTARTEALAAGAVAFLSKPFQEEVLLGAINSAIGKN